jgi:hypothetical protein
MSLNVHACKSLQCHIRPDVRYGNGNISSTPSLSQCYFERVYVFVWGRGV